MTLKRVTCIGSVFVKALLARLLRAHPALSFEVRLQDGFADLVRDGIDLAVRMGELRDSTLEARGVDWLRIVMVASQPYLKAHGTPRRLEDLAGHRAVAYRIPSTGRSRPWQLRQGRRTVEIHPAQSVQVSDTETLATAALLGMGVTQLPDHIVQDEVARGKLVPLLPDHRPAPMPISAVVPSGQRVPPRVQVLIEALEGPRERGG